MPAVDTDVASGRKHPRICHTTLGPGGGEQSALCLVASCAVASTIPPEVPVFDKSIVYLVAGILVAAGVIGYRITSRDAYENAAYVVELADGDFELRLYPELTLASTAMQGSLSGEDGSFMRLFGYISGKNARQEKIAMTVPVFMQSGDDETTSMQFVVPQALAEVGAPEPSAEGVRLTTRPAGRYAVVRFAGELTKATEELQRERLEGWMKARGLSPATPVASSAGYDPPWTPDFLRRNEVLIQLQVVPQE